MKITIEDADNGYIVTDYEGRKIVFGGENDLEVLKDMLVYVSELHHPYDKFGSENIHVSFDRKGHKVG
jgi:hypothetical protein